MRFKLQLFFGLSAVWLCLFLLTSITRLWGQSDNPSLRSQEEKEQVQNAERLLTILEKNPRKGTAFDRVYGHHLDFGTLDIFIDQLDERIEKSNEDDEAWMLLGLFESQRGEDEKSVDAFRKSVILRPADPLASYYLGQALVRVGQTSEAIEALEQAIERKPTRADLLEIFQYLGRLHQRAQRTNEAIKVWRRLEELFPDDLRVLEEIAVALAEEGDFASAMSRYERLSKLVDDDYRRILFRMAAAEMTPSGAAPIPIRA